MKNIIKTTFWGICVLLSVSFASAQGISEMQKKELINSFDKHIKTISAISSEKIEMISVYSYQIEKAVQFLEENERYNTDKDIYAKAIELKAVTEQNKELIDFLVPRASKMYYTRAVSLLSDNKKKEAYECLQNAVKLKPDNIMAQYELSKIAFDSSQILNTSTKLQSILFEMNPTNEEKQMCENLLHDVYNKSLLQSMALIKQGKYAYANDILEELQKWGETDKTGICTLTTVKKQLETCKKGIYNNHIDITKKAISKGEMKVAGDFIENTYDYFQRNKEDINKTESFDEVVHLVADAYIKQAKAMPEAKNKAVRRDLLAKAKDLSAMIGEPYESQVLKQIASVEGTVISADKTLDSLEHSAQNEGYSIAYNKYIKDTASEAEQSVTQIEKDYIASNENKRPKESVAVASTETKAIDRQVDEKFFETRQFMQVNNYEKALEVLEKANRLAKMEGDKQAVAQMYTKAIREITAKRMSQAEYCIFQGDTKKADSLVALTDDLIEAYNMQEDTAIVRIMNSYLRAIDNKVCQKKQDEINVLVYDILECIRRNDFFTAENYINKAIQIKGNNECRLDKSRIRALKRQIEEPLQYVKQKGEIEQLLNDGDTTKYFLEYAKLELFYNKNKLGDLGVNHIQLRDIMSSFKNDALAIKTTDNLVKYKQYEGAIEALGALKDMGYKAKHTKKAQKRIGKMMAFDSMKRQEKIEQSYRITDKYNDDKWFKYFLKAYKRNLIKFQKQGR